MSFLFSIQRRISSHHYQSTSFHLLNVREKVVEPRRTRRRRRNTSIVMRRRRRRRRTNSRKEGKVGMASGGESFRH